MMMAGCSGDGHDPAWHRELEEGQRGPQEQVRKPTYDHTLHRAFRVGRLELLMAQWWPLGAACVLLSVRYKKVENANYAVLLGKQMK